MGPTEAAPTIPAGSLEAEREAAAVFATGSPYAKYGALRGTVVDDEQRPIAGARVLLVAMQAERITRSDGSFDFGRVGAATWTAGVTHEVYEDQNLRVEVRPDQETVVTVVLKLLPDFRPYERILHLKGKYDCAASLLIVPGDCAPSWLLERDEGVTKEEFSFPFTYDYLWTQVLLELTWEDAGNNQLEGMRLKVSPGNDTNLYGHQTRLGGAEGAQKPVRLLLTNGEAHPTAENWTGTNTTATLDETGGKARALVQPRGRLAETTGTVCSPEDGRCLLGVGVGLDLKFDVYITVFYNKQMPEGYSAIGIS